MAPLSVVRSPLLLCSPRAILQVSGAAALALCSTAALADIRLDRDTVEIGETLNIEVDIPEGDDFLFLWLTIRTTQEADYHAGEIAMMKAGPLTEKAVRVEPGSVYQMAYEVGEVWCGMDALTDTCPLGTGEIAIGARLMSWSEPELPGIFMGSYMTDKPEEPEEIFNLSSQPILIAGDMTDRQQSWLARLLTSAGSAPVTGTSDFVNYSGFTATDRDQPIEVVDGAYCATATLRPPMGGTIRGCIDVDKVSARHRIVDRDDIEVLVSAAAGEDGGLSVDEAAGAASAVSHAWNSWITPMDQRTPVTFQPYPMVRPRIETPEGPAWHFEIRRDSTPGLWIFALVWDDGRVCLKDGNGEIGPASSDTCVQYATPDPAVWPR